MNATTKPRLLIVDDNRAVCGVLADEARATEQFAEVRTAHDGRKALETIARGCNGVAWIPEILLTDLYMPHLNGVELLHELCRRGLTPPARLVMSSSSDCGYERAAVKRAGVEEIYAKPSSADGVRALLRQSLLTLESRPPFPARRTIAD